MKDRFEKEKKAEHAAAAQDKGARAMRIAVAVILFSLAIVSGIMALVRWLAPV